jgi:hypothetical protein
MDRWENGRSLVGRVHELCTRKNGKNLPYGQFISIIKIFLNGKRLLRM